MNRPCFRSHLQIKLAGGLCVVASERGLRFVRNHTCARVAPLLDGIRTIEEIADSLGAELKREEVIGAVDQLERLGLLRDGPAEVSAEAAFWELAGADADLVAKRRPEASVEIISIRRTPVDGIPEALEAVGVMFTPGAPFRLVVARDYCDPVLAGINANALAENIPWMLTRPFGRAQWVGPLFIPGKTACWQCMVTALGLNGWTADAIKANLASAATITRMLAANEAARYLLTGTTSLAGRIRAFDTVALKFEAHHIIARPQCPACKGTGRMKPKLDYDVLVSSITGIVREPDQWFAEPGIYGVSAVSSRELWPDPNGVLFYSEPDRLFGKGVTPQEARTCCLGEAIERYSCRYHGDEQYTISSFSDLPDAVDPCSLLLYSDAQYSNRQQWNAVLSDFQRIGEPLSPDSQIAWTEVREFVSGRTRQVPTAYCFMGFEATFCGADSNGCAAGPTFEEAVLRGLLELVERDAVALWWYNRVLRPALNVRDVRVTSVFETLHRRGWRAHLLDLTTDFGIPVVGAVAARSNGKSILVGSGAAICVAEAAWRATSELATVVLSFERAPGAHFGNDVTTRWLHEAALDSHQWLVPDARGKIQSLNDPLPEYASLLECVRRVEQRGIQVLVLDVTRPEIGVPAVRVIAPGLRPWWARFAPGRLYDAPVALGWRNHPITEQELNPIPFFL